MWPTVTFEDPIGSSPTVPSLADPVQMFVYGELVPSRYIDKLFDPNNVPDQRPPVDVVSEVATFVPVGRNAETDDEYPPRWSFAETVGVDTTACQFVIELPMYVTVPYRELTSVRTNESYVLMSELVAVVVDPVTKIKRK